jgi:hypothetical protein
LNSRLNAFLLDINPPLVNDSLREALSDRTNAYRREVATEVLKHLDDQLQLLGEQMKKLKADDVNEAAHAAEIQLRQRLQRRFNPRMCKQDVAQVKCLIGFNACTVKFTTPVNCTTLANTVLPSNVPSNNNLNPHPNPNPIVNCSPSLNPDPVETTAAMDGIELLPPGTPPIITTKIDPKINLSNRFHCLSNLEEFKPSDRKRRVSSDSESDSTQLTPPPRSQRKIFRKQNYSTVESSDPESSPPLRNPTTTTQENIFQINPSSQLIASQISAELTLTQENDLLLDSSQQTSDELTKSQENRLLLLA